MRPIRAMQAMQALFQYRVGRGSLPETQQAIGRILGVGEYQQRNVSHFLDLLLVIHTVEFIEISRLNV